MRRRTFLGGASAAALTAITATGAAARVAGPAGDGGQPSADMTCDECLDTHDYDTCCGTYCTNCHMK